MAKFLAAAVLVAMLEQVALVVALEVLLARGLVALPLVDEALG